jgi:hypothetical protein
LKTALRLMALALIVALLAAFLLSNLALRPLTEISRQLDRLTPAGGSAGRGQRAKEGRGGAGLHKDREDRPAHAQRGRGLLRVARKSRPDSGQFAGRHLLFTEDKRAVLVSEAARRFLGRSIAMTFWAGMRGRSFPTTVLGRTLREADRNGRQRMVKEEIRTENGRRIQASVDFITTMKRTAGLGALVTLHDLESAEKIESELELSRRMAAIGRLTSGVGHEVKNPINAIVVHLELLKSKLGECGRACDEASGGDRRGDPAAGPRGADAGGLLAAGGAATATNRTCGW